MSEEKKREHKEDGFFWTIDKRDGTSYLILYWVKNGAVSIEESHKLDEFYRTELYVSGDCLFDAYSSCYLQSLRIIKIEEEEGQSLDIFYFSVGEEDIATSSVILPDPLNPKDYISISTENYRN